MKRVTSWPQAALGLAFSWGALMGWSARFGELGVPALLLYAAAFCWTIGYDTIYALQDARDDAIVGIKSTARLFGRHARLGVGAFYLADGGADAGGAACGRRRLDRRTRLGGVRRPPDVAARQGRRRERGDGAETLSRQPRRRPAAVPRVRGRRLDARRFRLSLTTAASRPCAGRPGSTAGPVRPPPFRSASKRCRFRRTPWRRRGPTGRRPANGHRFRVARCRR